MRECHRGAEVHRSTLIRSWLLAVGIAAALSPLPSSTPAKVSHYWGTERQTVHSCAPAEAEETRRVAGDGATARSIACVVVTYRTWRVDWSS